MGKYRIALTPVGRFFFGGDMTFKAEGREDLNDVYQSYIIRSGLFPQQTSLLGMLRFLILRNSPDCFKDGCISDPIKASERIGSGSFAMNSGEDVPGKKNSFGVIQKISRCRIQAVTPERESSLDVQPLYGKAMSWSECKGSYNGISITIPSLDYSAKDGGLDMILSDGVKKYGLDQIFEEDWRVGINRILSTGKTDDGALFKQISYRFRNTDDCRFRFVFEAEVEDVPLDAYTGQLVSVGGDNSWFVVDIKAVSVPAAETLSGDDMSITLLSPSFIPRRALSLTRYGITSLRPFRFLQTRTRLTKEYSILNKELKRSDKVMLYDAGSQFFFESKDQKARFAQILKAHEDFRQIGYNEYK